MNRRDLLAAVLTTPTAFSVVHAQTLSSDVYRQMQAARDEPILRRVFQSSMRTITCSTDLACAT